MADILGLLKKPSFLLRIVELVLAMAAIGVLQNSLLFMKDVHEVGLVYTVTSGFVLILTMLILERIVEETTSKKMAMAWSFIGAVLWFAAGGLIVNNWNRNKELYEILTDEMKEKMNRLLAAGIIALVNGFVFLADLPMTYKFD